MPNVTQAALDGLHQEVEDAENARLHTFQVLEEARQEWDRERAVLQARTAATDELLTKVIRAAHGVPILSRRDGRALDGVAGAFSDTEGWRFDPRTGASIPQPGPSDPLVRAEAREAQLQYELGVATARLQAVVTVAETALEHKA